MCAPHSEPSACFLPADTVVDSGRILRRPIDEWAAELTARLRSYQGKTRDLPAIRRFCAALNSAALVFVYGGQSEFAEDLCQSQLEWLGTFRELFPASELAVLALHPWVNLGRLCRRAKDFQRALRYFDSIHTRNAGGALQFDRWECGASEAVRQIAEPLCVYEIFRTHLQTGELEAALHFAASLDDSLPVGASMLKTELLLHVHLRRAEPHSLLALMKAIYWPPDHFGVLAKHFYSAVVLSALEHSHLSVKALGKVATHWIASLSRPERDPRDLRLAIEFCRLAKHLDRRDLFAIFFSAAASAIIEARDVPFAGQLLHLTNSFADCEGQAQLETFITRFGYKISPAPFGALAELKVAISNVLNVSERALCA